MGFLSPFLLASLAALAVPLWLHLRRKRRQNPVEFPSLRYLKMAAARMKRQARVEDRTLLALRMLLLALLAAAFARPVIRSGGSWFGAARAVESVVVIDATASMGWRGEAGTRMEVVKRLALEWIAGLDRKDAVALWVLTDRLEKPVPLPIRDRDFLLGGLDGVLASEGSSGLAPVFDAAREWVGTRGAGRRELVVITDNQAAAWDWPAEGFFRRAWNRSDVGLVVLSPDNARPANASVAAVEWSARAVREGGLLEGVVKLANHGEEEVSDLLECRMAGETVFRKSLVLPAGGSLEVPVTLSVPVVEGPVLAGELSLAGDALVCDDRWHFALPIRRTSRAVVVERKGGAVGGMNASFFLTRALAAGGAGKAEVIDPEVWRGQETDGIDSVWFPGGSVLDGPGWAKALAFAVQGGTMVIAGDCQPDPLPQDWPVTAGELASLPSGRVATRILAPSHPLFDGLWNERTHFPPLPQKTARKSVPVAGGKVLATLAGGFPLLVEFPRGKGRVIWLNASADRSWGDLPLSPVYVALVQQIARLRELSLQAATERWVGESWPGLSEEVAWSGASESSRLVHSGVFDAVSRDGEVLWRCVGNVRRAESDLRPVDAEQLQKMLPGRVVSGTRGLRQWRDEVRREVPVWPWLLAAAGVVYLAEGWLGAAAAKRREIGGGRGALP